MSNARDKANIPALNFSSTGIDDNATSTAITIDSNERVGIGTTSVSTNLQVTKASSGASGVLSAATVSLFENSGNTDIVIGAGNTSKSRIGFGDNGDAFNGRIDYDHSDRSMRFGTGGQAERMRITSSGNVGIGTTSPTGKLNISTASTDGINTLFGANVSPTAAGMYVGFNDSDATATLGVYYASSPIPVINITRSDRTIKFMNDASEHMRITSAGSVGIGTNSPSAKLHVDTSNSAVAPNAEADDFFVESSGNTGITIGSGISSRSSLYFANSTDNDIARIVVSHADGTMRFHNNASERMRIDSSGYVGIGTTSPTTELRVIGQISTQSNTNQNGFSQNCIGTPANYYFDVRDDNTGIFRIISNKRIQTNGGTTMRGHLNLIGERGQNFLAIGFEHSGGGGEVGNITTTSSSTSYNTSSDYRLKENVNYDFDATSRLKQLKPARFNFIADADTTVDGFLAHEVSSIVPEAISGTKDAVQVWEEGDELPEGVSVGDNKLDENGNTIPVYQSIDQSKLVPLLVKTIQELEARITALETNNP